MFRLRKSTRTQNFSRRGVTLAELMVASTIMAMVAVGFGAITMTVQTANDHSQTQREVAQHARICIDYLQQLILDATANEHFPGFAAFSSVGDVANYTNVLVVWQPEEEPVHPQGLPLFSELVFVMADPIDATRLIHVSGLNDSRTVPDLSKQELWRQEIARVVSRRALQDATVVELTGLLEPVSFASHAARGQPQLGRVRFDVTYRPTVEDWLSYKDDQLKWDSISWAQGIHGTKVGLRQSWCRIEFSLMSHSPGNAEHASGIPFFSSSAIYYELQR